MKHIMPLLQPLLDIPLQHINTSWKESVEAISERLLSKDYSSAEEFVVEVRTMFAETANRQASTVPLSPHLSAVLRHGRDAFEQQLAMIVRPNQPRPPPIPAPARTEEVEVAMAQEVLADVEDDGGTSSPQALHEDGVMEQAQEEDWLGCFCGTDRHCLTNTLPFEGVWVQCDTCDRWCHGECAGVDKETAEQLESYRCPACGGDDEEVIEGPIIKGYRLSLSRNSSTGFLGVYKLGHLGKFTAMRSLKGR